MQQHPGLPAAFRNRRTIDLHEPGALDTLFSIHRSVFGGMTMEETDEEAEARKRAEAAAGRTFTQDELTAKLTEEKRQGERAAARKIMETLGFETIAEAEKFIKERREAEAAAQTEQQRKEAEIAERERKAEERDRNASVRERTADIKVALIERGSTGEDLADALALIQPKLAGDDVDEDDITAAADKLKERRPELFAAPVTTGGKTKGALPGGKPGARKNPEGTKPGAAGRAAAAARGFKVAGDQD